MLKDMPKKDFRTLGFVLRRTNYGEADRILNIITPQGKISAIAKAARKEKSKLAGGIEMFSLVDLNLHQGKSDFAIITSAKMVKYYKNILKDYDRMNFASTVLKQVSRAADNTDNEEYFEIIEQCFSSLDENHNLLLIESWFWLNLRKAMGEEINLYRDDKGEKLSADQRYDWDIAESAFSKLENGDYGANEIKMLRLMTTTNLKTVEKVKVDDEFLQKILRIARIVAKV